MAINSPAVNVGVEKFFQALYPRLDKWGNVGVLDFSDEVAPLYPDGGMKFKFPITDPLGSTDGSYTNGQNVAWATALATKCKHSWNLRGIDLDSGADASKFATRYALAGSGAIGIDIDDIMMQTLEAAELEVVASGAVPTTAADYISAIAEAGVTSLKCGAIVSPSRYGDIIAKFAAVNIVRKEDIIQALGVSALEVANFSREDEVDFLVAPFGALGLAARKVEHAADFTQEGYITDDKTGLTIGMVVANDQGGNAKIWSVDGYLIGYAVPGQIRGLAWTQG